VGEAGGARIGFGFFSLDVVTFFFVFVVVVLLVANFFVFFRFALIDRAIASSSSSVPCPGSFRACTAFFFPAAAAVRRAVRAALGRAPRAGAAAGFRRRTFID
jgi:hypothetical protein|tara:strand:- start:121 stop:429 length:309 start_codon:yes stop_codon:yes gene_type:complete